MDTDIENIKKQISQEKEDQAQKSELSRSLSMNGMIHHSSRKYFIVIGAPIIALILIIVLGFTVIRLNSQSELLELQNEELTQLPTIPTSQGEVKGSLVINIPTLYQDSLTIQGNAVFEGEVTSPNIINNVTVGGGLASTGGQSPTISNTGVLSLAGQTGAVALVAGEGIAIDGLTISSTISQGNDQNIFSTISAGGTSFSADSTGDTLSFTAGKGITLSTDTANKAITITSTVTSELWTQSGNFIYLSNTAGNVGIGTAIPSEKLEIDGNLLLSGSLQIGGDGNSFTSLAGNGLTNTSNTLTLSLLDSEDGVGNISSRSGLEFAGANSNQLSLLQGCSDGQLLKWDGTTNMWKCSADVGGLSSAVVNVQEGDVMLTNSADTLDFNASDFSLTESPAGEVNIVIDYTNSLITRSSQNEVITGNWSIDSPLQISSQNSLRLADSDSSHYVAFQAPSALADNVTYTLPDDAGTNNYVLTTDGDGVLSWQSVSGVGALSGSGTTNTLPKFTGSTSIGDSSIADDGTTVVITANTDISGTFTSGTADAFQINAAGNIISGTWNGTAIGTQYGGTGINTSASTGVPYIASGTWTIESSLDETRGGTGQTTYTTGDLLYASSANTLSKLPIGTTNEILIVSGGVPTWSSASGAELTYWQRISGTISPLNISDDLLIGSNATSSALVRLPGVTNQHGWFNSGGNFGIGTTTPTAAKLDVSGSINISNAQAYYIDGNSVLSADTLGSGVTSSSLTSVGVLSSGSITSGFGTITTSNAITGSNLNAISGALQTNSVNRIDNSGNLTNIGTTQFNGVTYTWPGADAVSSGYVLTSDSTGNLSWQEASGIGGVGDITAIGDVTSGAAFTTGGSGSSLFFHDSGFEGEITTNTFTGNQTYTLPNSSGTFCLTSGNCAGTGAGIGGSGTANYISKFSSQFGITDSSIFDNGNIGIGTTDPLHKLSVVGTTNITGAVIFGDTLGITGATTLSSTLSVAGNTTFNAVTYTWPGSQANGANYILTNDGSGTLSWLDPGDLPNMNLWQQMNGALSPLDITNDLLLGATATSSATVKLPGLSNQNAFFNLGTGNLGIGLTNPTSKLHVSGTANITGATTLGSTLGVTGNFAINTNKFTVAAATGNTNIAGTLSSIGNVGIGTTSTTNQLTLNAPITTDALATAIFTPTAATNKGLIIQGYTGQSANLQEWQLSDGGLLASMGTSQLIINDVSSLASYNNPNGSGDRTSTMSVSTNFTGTTCISDVINGDLSSVDCNVPQQSISGIVITFDFGAGAQKVITEAKWYQYTIYSWGTWKWQGSNNGSTWTDIGSNFTLGGAATQTHTTLSGNSTGYRYYQLTAVSTGNSPIAGYIGEVEFKIADASNAGNTYLAGGFVGIGTNALTHKLNIEGSVTGKSLVNLNYTGTDQNIFTASASGTTKFVINKDGNVGIGTTNPTSPLHVFYSGGDTTEGFVLDTKGSSISFKPAFSIIVPTTGNKRALQFVTGTDSFAWASFEYHIGGVSKPGVNFGPGGLSSRDTNLYREAADILKTDDTFQVGTVLQVLGSGNSYFTGNLGIGTTTPLAALDLSGSASMSGTLTFRGSTNPKINILNGKNFGIQTSSGGDSGLSEVFTILNSGNLGIGTTAPDDILSIVGRNADISHYSFFGSASGGADYDFYRARGTKASPSIVSDADKLGGITFNSYDGSSYIESANILSYVDGTPGGSGDMPGRLEFQTRSDGTDGSLSTKLIIKNDGNIGIGTTTPLHKLSVAGTSNITGAVTLGDTLGVSGNTSLTGDLTVNGGDITSSATTFNFLDSTVTTLNIGGNATTNFGGGYGSTGLSIDSNGNLSLNGDVIIDETISLGGQVYDWSGATPSDGFILSTNASGELAWLDPGDLPNTNDWQRANGSIAPLNTTDDLLLGNTATSSALIRLPGLPNQNAWFNLGTGNLGIGTTTPVGLLNVSGSSVGKALVNLNYTGTDQNIFTASASGTTKFVINKDGNVGIGTIAPTASLHIDRSYTTTDIERDGLILDAAGSGSSASYQYLTGMYISTENAFTGNHGNESFGVFSKVLTNSDITRQFAYGFYSDITTHGNVNADSGYGFYAKGNTDSGGGIHYGFFADLPDTDANRYGLYLKVEPGTGTDYGVYQQTANDNYFAGNIGIGITNPLHLLSVAGTTNITGATTLGSTLSVAGNTTLNSVTYTWPGSQATGANYILVNNGSGTLSWLDPGDLPNTNDWQRITGALSPLDITDDLLLGATATTSATVRLPGLTNQNAFFNLGTGNLGIGTTTPFSPVNIVKTNGGTVTTALTLSNSSNSNNTASKLVFNLSSSNTVESAFMQAIRTNSPVSGDTELIFGNSQERLRIASTGNIGIGTSTPTSAKLEVSGRGYFTDRVGIGNSLPNAMLHVQSALGAKFVTENNYNGVGFVTINHDGAGSGPALYTTNETPFGSCNASVDGALFACARSGTYAGIFTGGNVGIGTTTPEYALQLSTNSAAKPSSSAWTIASDRRLKTDINAFTDGLSIINQINPVNYTLNGLGNMPSGTKGIGIIAQDIKDIAPYTIGTFKAKLHPTDTQETELYNFDSSALTFVLINAVKELNSKVDTNAQNTPSFIINSVGELQIDQDTTGDWVAMDQYGNIAQTRSIFKETAIGEAQIGDLSVGDLSATSGEVETLTVKNLVVENISGLTASSSAFFNLGAGIEADFAEFDFATINADLTVLGTTTLREAAITESLAIGAGELMITSNSINTLSSALEIQPLKQQPVSIMAGAVTFNTDGTVKFKENVEFEKNVAVKGTLTTTEVNINQAEVIELSSTQATASASAGRTSIAAGETYRRINTPFAKENSLISVTPEGKTRNQVLYISEKGTGYFIVNIEDAVSQNISFTFLIVNTKTD